MANTADRIWPTLQIVWNPWCCKLFAQISCMALFGMQLQPFEIQYKQMIIFLVEYSITQSITMFGNAHILTALF